MKKTLFLLAFLAGISSLNAQDIMVRKGGGAEKVRVLKVTPTKVWYNKIGELRDSTIYKESCTNLFYLRYEDGNLLTFDKENNNSDEVTAYYSKDDNKKDFTHELNLYFQNGWGVGYQLRYEFNQFVGLNMVNFTYKSKFCSPKEVGQFNYSPLGIRLHTPIYESIRTFTELNLGYTLIYMNDQNISIPGYGKININGDTLHHLFGMNFTTGIQFHKNFAIGYNLEFFKNKDMKLFTHWGKILIIF